jgi:AraC-like DNA-binding protein
MNPLPKQTQMGRFPETSFQTPIVQVSISSIDISEVVKLLVSHQISFFVSTIKDEGILTRQNDNKPELPTQLRSTSPKMSQSARIQTVIENTYQKYLVEKIEQMPPTYEQIAEEIGLSAIMFKNRFRELYGKPFYQIYLEKRMEYAAQLLKEGHKAVEVSRRIGYGDKSCIKFNKMFQKHFGMTPKKYQMSQK